METGSWGREGSGTWWEGQLQRDKYTWGQGTRASKTPSGTRGTEVGMYTCFIKDLKSLLITPPLKLCPLCSTPCPWLHRAGGSSQKPFSLTEVGPRMEEKKTRLTKPIDPSRVSMGLYLVALSHSHLWVHHLIWISKTLQ